MSDLNNTPKKAFRPVLITEEKLKTNDVIDGYLYFATDSRKIYLGENNEYLSMGGNSGVYYGNREPLEGEEDLESTEFNFIISLEIEGDTVPNVDDLILNTPDKSFYRVRQVFAEDDYLIGEKLAIAGGSGSGGSGSVTPGMARPTIQNLQSNMKYYSASKPETMKIVFQGSSLSAENNYIDHVEYQLGSTPIIDYTQYQFGEDIVFDFSKYIDQLNTSGGNNTLTVLIEDAFQNRSQIGVSSKFLFYILNPVLKTNEESILKVSSDAPGLQYTYIPTGGSASGSLERYLEVTIASSENPTNPIYFNSKKFTSLNDELSISIDFSEFSATHGTYILQAIYRVKVVDTGDFIDSNVLQHQVIYLEEGNREPVLATSFISGSIQQYTKYLMDYMIADGDVQQDVNVAFYIENDSDERIAILNKINTWDYTFTKVGSYNIAVEYADRKWKLGLLTVEEYSSEDIPSIDESIPELYLTPTGKKNTQSNKDTWEWTNPHTKEVYSAEFTNFLWGNENGWIEDPDGEPALKLTNGAQLKIPNYQPFKRDAKNGFTIEVDFMFSKVMDYNKPLIHCLSRAADGTIATGFNINGQKATLNSNTYKATDDEIDGEEGAGGVIDAGDMALQAFTQYFNEDTRIHLTYVIEKLGTISTGNYYFVYTYLNGVLSGIMRMEANEGFSQNINDPAIFTVDSTYADIYLYSIRTYTQALAPRTVVNNYIADIGNIDKKINLAKKNDILNDSGVVSKKVIDQLSVSLGVPYVVFEGGIPIHKQFTKKKLIKEGFLDGYPMSDVTNYNLPVTKSDYRLFSVGMYERDGNETKTLMEVPISLENSSTGEIVDNFDNIEEGTKYWFNRGVQVYGQGTSSMVYPVKNLRLRFMNEKDYPTIYKGSCPVEIVCFKADYMDSSASHNTQTGNLVYDLYNALGLKTPPQKFAYKPYDITTAIKGYPIICFYKDYNNDNGKNDDYSDGEYIYIGRYNFNMDKATPEPFGFPGMAHKTGKSTTDENGRTREEVEVCGLLTEEVNGMTVLPLEEVENDDGTISYEEVYQDIAQCWEILNNDTNSPTKFLTPDGNYSDYQSALEATWADYYEDRYPDEIVGLYEDNELENEENAFYKDALHDGLFRMSTWVNSTATTELPPADTKLEEVVYYLTLDDETPTEGVQYYDKNHELVSVEKVNTTSISTNSTGETVLDPSKVSIDLNTFENKVGQGNYNTYTFSYNENVWDLFYYDEKSQSGISEQNVSLSDYGITLLSVSPEAGQSIIIDYTYSYSNWIPGSLWEKHEYDNARYRLAKFKNEFTEYFDMDFSLFYYVLTLVLLMMDSRAKNMMLASWDTKIWYPIFYDMDTMLGVNNTGFNKFSYDTEDDPEDKVFNGFDSVLWNNFRTCFYTEIAEFYSKLRDVMSLEKLLSAYNDNGADAWVENLHVKDAIYKYERPYEQGYYDGKDGKEIAPGAISYLYAAQGKRSTHRSWWLKNRLGYLDSKYKPEALGNEKPSQSETFSFRAYALPAQQSSDAAQQCVKEVPANHKFNITALTNSYQSIFVGNIVYGPKYTKAGETVAIGPDSPKHEVESYILNPDLIADLGDLSDKYLGSWNMPKNKLTELKFGRSSRSHPNTNYEKYYNSLLTNLNIGETTPYLRKLNIARCIGLVSLDVSYCNKLEEIDAEGANNLTNITFPSDSILKELYLPKSLQNIVIDNQPYLTTIEFDEIPAMTKIHLNNVDKYDSYQLAKKSFSPVITDKGETKYNTVTYYLTGVNWVIDDFEDGATVDSIPLLESLIDIKSFVPEEGQSRATALTGTITLKGDIHVDEFVIYERYKEYFPNIEFKYDIGENGSLNEAVSVTFMSLERGSEDNSVHYEVKASGDEDGDNLSVLVSAQGPNKVAMTAPKKNSTVESSFEFTGYWIYGETQKYYDPAFFADNTDVVHPTGATSFEDTTPMVDMTFYPEYKTTPKKYEVTFHDPDGNVIPQEVASGGTPVNSWEVQYGELYDGPILNYYYKDDSSLGEEETYFFKGWGTTRGATDPVYVDPTNLEVKSNLNLYAYVEKINVYNIPQHSRYKDMYYNYFDISDSTISLKDEYKCVLKGKIIIPSQDENNNYLYTLGDFREGGDGGITHIYFMSDAQYTTIEKYAFSGNLSSDGGVNLFNSKIKKILLPSTITEIKDNAFESNFVLEDINWSNLTNLLKVGDGAFKTSNSSRGHCQVKIEELPETLTYIGLSAFWYPSESVVVTKIPTSVTYIGDSAFAFAPSVAVTEFGSRDNNIQMTISSQAFYAVGKNISSISDTLILNESVVKVDSGAFGASGSDFGNIYTNIKTVYLRYGAENYNNQQFAGEDDPKSAFVNYIGLTNVENIFNGEEGDIVV